MEQVIKFKDKIVGKVLDDTYFTKLAIMRIYQGFGLSVVTLELLKDLGVKKINVLYKGVKGDRHYEFTLNQWLESNLKFTKKDGDFQKFVRIKDGKEVGK